MRVLQHFLFWVDVKNLMVDSLWFAYSLLALTKPHLQVVVYRSISCACSYSIYGVVLNTPFSN
jgi:hypothetical protein